MARLPFLWHCGWCHPLAPWQRWLRRVGICWTTGMCQTCFQRVVAEHNAKHPERAHAASLVPQAA